MKTAKSPRIASKSAPKASPVKAVEFSYDETDFQRALTLAPDLLARLSGMAAQIEREGHQVIYHEFSPDGDVVPFVIRASYGYSLDGCSSYEVNFYFRPCNLPKAKDLKTYTELTISNGKVVNTSKQGY